MIPASAIFWSTYPDFFSIPGPIVPGEGRADAGAAVLRPGLASQHRGAAAGAGRATAEQRATPGAFRCAAGAEVAEPMGADAGGVGAGRAWNLVGQGATWLAGVTQSCSLRVMISL